jgi:hypothetical protein
MSQSTRKWVIVESTSKKVVSTKTYESPTEAAQDLPKLTESAKFSGSQLVVKELLLG